MFCGVLLLAGNKGCFRVSITYQMLLSELVLQRWLLMKHRQAQLAVTEFVSLPGGLNQLSNILTRRHNEVFTFCNWCCGGALEKRVIMPIKLIFIQNRTPGIKRLDKMRSN